MAYRKKTKGEKMITTLRNSDMKTWFSIARHTAFLLVGHDVRLNKGKNANSDYFKEICDYEYNNNKEYVQDSKNMDNIAFWKKVKTIYTSHYDTFREIHDRDLIFTYFG